MLRNHSVIAMMITASSLPCAAALGQSDPGEPIAFVTVLGGGGAVRIDTEPPTRISRVGFSFEQHALGAGQGVRTVADGTAVLMLPRFGTTVYLEQATELRVAELPEPDGQVGAFLLLVEGQASVIQKPGQEQWLLLATGPDAGRVTGYTLSTGASQFVIATAAGASFSLRRGEAWFATEQVPAGALITASGQPVDQTGVHVPPGQTVSTQVPGRPVAGTEDTVAPSGLGEDIFQLALVQSDVWLQEAEEGDFTPIRTAGRGAPQVMSVELQPRPAFDQARPAVAAPSPGPTPAPVRTSLDPATALVQSDVPGTIVAGQRYRRSRIIGNPGTTGTGALTVNRAAELLIRLGGN